MRDSIELKQVLKSFVALDPVLSPDRSWMIWRRFHPASTEIEISEIYLLFDLRSGDLSARIPMIAYPQLKAGSSLDPLDVPPDDIHRFRSDRFSWSNEGEGVVFADSVAGQLHLVLIKTTEPEVTASYYPVEAGSDKWKLHSSSNCDGTLDAEVVTVDAEFVGPSTIKARLYSKDSDCYETQANILLAEFLSAKKESYTHRNLRHATRISEN